MAGAGVSEADERNIHSSRASKGGMTDDRRSQHSLEKKLKQQASHIN